MTTLPAGGGHRVHDVVIVGGGHNGLVAAHYLASAGLDVVVLERRHAPGGAAATEELFPGFHISSCSFSTHVLQDRVVRDLQLRRHGLRVHVLDPELLAPFPDGARIVRWRDVDRTAAEIATLSARDAERYPAWVELWRRAGGIFDRHFLSPEPPTVAELAGELAGTPDGALLERLRAGSIRELLDEHFVDARVQAALLANMDIRSLDEAGQPLGWASITANMHTHPANQGLVIGGMGALTGAMAAAARAAGASVRLGAEVRRIVLDGDGAAAGVELCDGQVVRARRVVSNATPQLTFLELLEQPPAAARAVVESLEATSASLKFHAATSALPDFGRFLGGDLRAAGLTMVRIAPSIDYVHRSLSEAAAGVATTHPVITLQVPTVLDPTIAPPGAHIVSAWVKFEPPALAEGDWDAERVAAGERVIDAITAYAPNFRSSIIDWTVYTPLDMERRVGLTAGNIHHIDHSQGQLLGERGFGRGGYRTPVPNLYLCGAATHPGGEVSGAPGHNAARALLADVAAVGGR